VSSLPSLINLISLALARYGSLSGARPSSLAVLELMIAKLSQVTLLRVLGNSCSHELLAKRLSQHGARCGYMGNMWSHNSS
jgi:hypothetical protein